MQIILGWGQNLRSRCFPLLGSVTDPLPPTHTPCYDNPPPYCLLIKAVKASVTCNPQNPSLFIQIFTHSFNIYIEQCVKVCHLL